MLFLTGGLSVNRMRLWESPAQSTSRSRAMPASREGNVARTALGPGGRAASCSRVSQIFTCLQVKRTRMASQP